MADSKPTSWADATVFSVGILATTAFLCFSVFCVKGCTEKENEYAAEIKKAYYENGGNIPPSDRRVDPLAP